jgi:DNA-binding transcriptional LysR family regulator
MDIILFTAFREVMITGSVSKAAATLGKSQPSVSRMLDRLEHELGIMLFERRKGLISPTAEAHLLLEEVERAFFSFKELKSFAARLSKGEGASIHLASMPALGISFLPQVLTIFRNVLPGTKVTLNVRMSSEIESWASSQQIDLGLAEMPFRKSGFTTEIFSDAPYVAVVPRGHFLEDYSHIGPHDLCNGPLIYWTSSLPSRHLFDRTFQAVGVRVDPLYETTNSATAYEMVKRGLGIALLDPFTAVMQQDDRAKIVPFMPKVPFIVALLRPETRKASAAADILLQIMRDECNKVRSLLPSGL